MRLREAVTVEPAERISDLPTGIFDVAGESVKCSWATEGEEVSTRLSKPQQTLEFGHRRDTAIPFVPHEVEAIRWVEKSTVKCDGRKSWQHIVDVAVVDGPASICRAVGDDAIRIVVGMCHGGCLSLLRVLKCVDVPRPLAPVGRKRVLEKLEKWIVRRSCRFLRSDDFLATVVETGLAVRPFGQLAFAVIWKSLHEFFDELTLVVHVFTLFHRNDRLIDQLP